MSPMPDDDDVYERNKDNPDFEPIDSGSDEDISPNMPNGGTVSTDRVNEVFDYLKGKIGYKTPLQRKASISLVPRALRVINEEAYTPQVISIGPYHHGNERLKSMEEHKLRYFDDISRRGSTNSYQVVIANLIELETRARACYEGTISLNENEFVKMMLLDGCFIIELLFKYYESKKEVVTRDPLFRKPSILQSLRFDMLLLENQLPFFVVERLFVLFSGFADKFTRVSLLQLILHFFSFQTYVKIARGTPRQKENGVKLKHFLDLLRDCCLPSEKGAWLHLDQRRVDTRNEVIPSAMELHEAGVKFTKVNGNCFVDMKFSTEGVFEIPPLTFNSYTEVVFRNLVAFEQCFQRGTRNFISLYLYLMDSLINSTNDVAILRRYGIIDSFSDDEHVCHVFNTICKGVVFNTNIHFYREITEDANNYYKTPWNSFKALLFREYFYSPWSIASSVAVIIVVICTIIQTVCTVKSVIP